MWILYTFLRPVHWLRKMSIWTNPGLYIMGEKRICVCVLRGNGRWGSGRGSYTHKSPFFSASTYPRNQRGVESSGRCLVKPPSNERTRVWSPKELMFVHRQPRMNRRAHPKSTGGNCMLTLPSMELMVHRFGQLWDGGCGFWTLFFLLKKFWFG